MDLEAVEERNLFAQGFLIRPCKTCGGNTRWERYETAQRVRLPRDEPAAGQKRILVIDDDESILFVIKKAIGGEPFELEMANSARKAVMLLARGDYDLILSDVRMPEFDGKQLFRFLDEHMPKYRNRIIFLTGDTGNPETMQFLETNRTPYLSKPLDMPELLKLIRTFLGGM